MGWMEWLMKGILGLEVGFFAFCLVALVFLVVRRVKKRRSEKFEKRDN